MMKPTPVKKAGAAGGSGITNTTLPVAGVGMRRQPLSSGGVKPTTGPRGLASSLPTTPTPPTTPRDSALALPKIVRSRSSVPLAVASASALRPASPLTLAAKRREAASASAGHDKEKDLLIAALKEQLAALEARYLPVASEDSDNPDNINNSPSTLVEKSPSVKIAELQAQVKLQDLMIAKLEARASAFVSKDSAISFLMQEKEASEARLDMIIKDKDMTIETMRRQIEMQVSGLFSEVNKSRELLVSQAETHAEDLKRLNNVISEQANELGQLRERVGDAIEE
ncbi:hypothetical protein HK100_006687 [Physocladia obscura]|uniref:Uncharacterized protein n=1 Tax=Physocladia obscura TaxID=109957 RepID=A0AAD5XF44_9FUNG|nr:hypothetical protein HK100_006687 [Physocladia obscura]